MEEDEYDNDYICCGCANPIREPTDIIMSPSEEQCFCEYCGDELDMNDERLARVISAWEKQMDEEIKESYMTCKHCGEEIRNLNDVVMERGLHSCCYCKMPLDQTHPTLIEWIGS